MGIVLVAFMAARTTGAPSCYNDGIDFEPHHLRRKLNRAIGGSPTSRIPVLDRDVLSFYEAKLAQCQPNGVGTRGLCSSIGR